MLLIIECLIFIINFYLSLINNMEEGEDGN